MIFKRRYLLTVFLCLLNYLVLTCSELIFVHALWRHGDRNPVHVIPSDTRNNESSWVEGLGELTKQGITGQYNLGKLLRTRYIDNLKFIHPCSASSEIHVRSTDYNRTLMSAYSLLAGLLRNSCNQDQLFAQQFVKNWYPFPVHTVLIGEDSLLGDDAPCPKVDWLFREKIQKSADYVNVENVYRTFFQFISSKTAQFINFSNISRVFDPLRCTSLHSDQHPMPDWVNESVFATVKMLYEKEDSLEMLNNEFVKLKRGQLLGEIVQRFNDKVNTLNVGDDWKWLQKMRFYAYSAHDSTVQSFLATLGIYEFTKFFVPDYSACVLLELWKTYENNYIVKLLLRKNVTDEFKEMQMHGCPDLPEPCLLSIFTKRAQKFIPKDLKLECSMDSWLFLHFNHLIYALVAIIIVSLLGSVIIFGAIIRKLTNSHRKYDGYQQIRMDNISEKLITGNLFDNLLSEDDEDFDKV